MKKVVFLHATVTVKNSINLPSVIMHSIPAGLFSRVRPLTTLEQETILAGILKDLQSLTEFQEIIVVTSEDPADNEIVATVEHLPRGRIPVMCHRVPTSVTYAISPEQRFSAAHDWPYFFSPIYGAWHQDGFLTLTKLYSASAALLLQADGAALLDCSYFDTIARTYAATGGWAERGNEVQEEWAMLNSEFIQQLKRKYERRLAQKYEKTHHKQFFQVNALLKEYGEDEHCKEQTVTNTQQIMPCAGMYRPSDIEKYAALATADLSRVTMYADAHAYLPVRPLPTFIDIALRSETENKWMPFERFTACVDQAGWFVFGLNLYCAAFDAQGVQYLSYAYRRTPLVILECAAGVIDTISQEDFNQLRTLIHVLHIHVDASSKVETIIERIESLRQHAISERPYLVLEMTPHDVEKFQSLEQCIDVLLIKAQAHDPDFTVVNFSPAERGECKKLATSLHYTHSGEYAPCRYMSRLGLSHGTVREDFLSSGYESVRQAHVAGDFSALPVCAQCREWYIPDVPLVFPLSICSCNFAGQGAVLQYAQDPEKAVRMITQIEWIVSSNEQSCLQLDRTWLRAVPQSFLRGKAGLLAFLYEIGKQLWMQTHYDTALSAWETVLRYNPAHADIHAALDAILQKEIPV